MARASEAGLLDQTKNYPLDESLVELAWHMVASLQILAVDQSAPIFKAFGTCCIGTCCTNPASSTDDPPAQNSE